MRSNSQEPNDADAHNGLGLRIGKAAAVRRCIKEYRIGDPARSDDASYRQHYVQMRMSRLAGDPGEKEEVGGCDAFPVDKLRDRNHVAQIATALEPAIKSPPLGNHSLATQPGSIAFTPAASDRDSFAEETPASASNSNEQAGAQVPKQA